MRSTSDFLKAISHELIRDHELDRERIEERALIRAQPRYVGAIDVRRVGHHVHDATENTAGKREPAFAERCPG